jgi:hypothetical protein
MINSYGELIMKYFVSFIIALNVAAVFACDDGFLPHNNFQIPINSILANDMTEEQFKANIKRFEDFFGPQIENELNQELIVFKSWKSNTVNAYAEKAPGKVMITIYGGLARHKAITQDGLTLVLCHELGHHFGGFPKKNTNIWSSAEGQADYYSSMKCLRRIWAKADNATALNSISIPEHVKNECAKTYSKVTDQLLCQRMSMAGRSMSLMIQDLDHDSIEPKFETPDDLQVRSTNIMHPFAQCRLDTIFNGAICPVSETIEFDNDDETSGACHEKLGDSRGTRPRCWFVPRI